MKNFTYFAISKIDFNQRLMRNMIGNWLEWPVVDVVAEGLGVAAGGGMVWGDGAELATANTTVKDHKSSTAMVRRSPSVYSSSLSCLVLSSEAPPYGSHPTPVSTFYRLFLPPPLLPSFEKLSSSFSPVPFCPSPPHPHPHPATLSAHLVLLYLPRSLAARWDTRYFPSSPKPPMTRQRSNRWNCDEDYIYIYIHIIYMYVYILCHNSKIDKSRRAWENYLEEDYGFIVEWIPSDNWTEIIFLDTLGSLSDRWETQFLFSFIAN